MVFMKICKYTKLFRGVLGWKPKYNTIRKDGYNIQVVVLLAAAVAAVASAESAAPIIAVYPELLLPLLVPLLSCCIGEIHQPISLVAGSSSNADLESER